MSQIGVFLARSDVSGPQYQSNNLDNRAKAWLGGLAGFLLLSLIAAFMVGGKENVDLLTLSTDAEVAAGVDDFGSSGVGEPGDVIIDDVTDDGAFVTSTVPAVATAVPFATSTPFPSPTPLATATPTPIPTLPADAETPVPAEADPSPTAATLASEATVQPTTEAEGEGEGEATTTGISTPTPPGGTPIPGPTPSGPGAFRVGTFEAEGATVTVNTMTVKVNEDGTGTATGALSINWPDGRTVGLKVDDSFTWNTSYEDIRVGLDAEYNVDAPGDDNDIVEARGTMRIPKQALRIGSICTQDCFTFDY